MWVAYLVPREDCYDIIRDGLGFIEAGATKEEAEAKVRKKYADDVIEQEERWLAAGYEPMPETEREGPLEDYYVLHTNEV